MDDTSDSDTAIWEHAKDFALEDIDAAQDNVNVVVERLNDSELKNLL